MISLVRDRLREQLVPNPLRMVDGATAWAALQAPPPEARMPCAYVIPATLSAGPNILAAGGTRQQVRRSVAVMLCTRNLRDTRGEAAQDEVEQLLGQVFDVLLGWKPSEQDSVMLLGDGALRSAEGGLVVWQQHFSSQRLITKV